jgi:hypothetical protein
MASITRFYALILSTVLLLSGVPGFFPSIPSFQALVTFFALTPLHSVVHTAMGLLGLLITTLASDESVRIYTIGIALLYGILAAVGIAGVSFGPMLYFNSADNWLHGSIFVLSLGVFLAGITEHRLHQSRARIAADLPASHWALPSGPVQPAQVNRASGSSAPRPSLSQDAASASGQNPWSSRPTFTQQSQPEPQQTWAADPWAPSQQPIIPPPVAPQVPPGELGQPRDPWTREQRRRSTPQPLPRPVSAPFPDQQPGGPWPQNQRYAPQQDPWQQEQWPGHQSAPTPPQQHAPAPNPWSIDPQPAPNPWQQDAPMGDQWPLDEWPSLHDPRRS